MERIIMRVTAEKKEALKLEAKKVQRSLSNFILSKLQ